MSAHRSKQHHIVPQVLQRQFAEQANKLWHSKVSLEGQCDAPRLKEIKKVFKLRNYYTVLENNELSERVEKEFYAKIDGYLGSVLPQINASFEKGSTPTFPGEELERIRRVILEMAKRTPDFTKPYEDAEIGKEVLQSALSEIADPRTSKEGLQLLSDLNDHARLRDLGRNVRVRGTIERSERVEAALQNFSVRWALSKTNHSFILSSRMVYRIGNGGPNGLSNPNMEIWMPLGPKTALVLLRDPKNHVPMAIELESRKIREVNEYARRTSREIASGSRKLMESLTGKKAVTWKPENADVGRKQQL